MKFETLVERINTWSLAGTSLSRSPLVSDAVIEAIIIAGSQDMSILKEIVSEAAMLRNTRAQA